MEDHSEKAMISEEHITKLVPPTPQSPGESPPLTVKHLPP